MEGLGSNYTMGSPGRILVRRASADTTAQDTATNLSVAVHRRQCSKSAAGYKLKTYNMAAVVWFFNSGAFSTMNGHIRAPTSTATYCLPRFSDP